MSIAGRRVAEDIPPFVIAEIGINHGGSLERALALVDAAAAAGAHAVKLQTIRAEELVAPSCPAPSHVEAESLVEFFRQFELDEAAHHEVAARASLRGLKVISTPFSESSVDMLERVGVDAYKIASGDLTWDQLIVRCASTGKPLIISTGMSTLAEAHHALAVARLAGAEHVALLHCVSAYPVPKGSENLLAIRTLANECRVPVGLSDHGEDAFALPIAVGLGASLYERHLVLPEDTDAIDRAVSSTPSELAAAIRAGRRAWSSLGSGRKACLAAEAANAVASRRSLCATRGLPAGHVLTSEDLVALRPATGVPPSMIGTVLGRRLARPIDLGQPLTAAHLDHHTITETHRVA
ncbi:MAG: N-acetylneuraminate synthase family protein [Acidobacteria bacterium]|nr:N-acetylneuraminate synthase family protein [Acidobacteriota bacterium]